MNASSSTVTFAPTLMLSNAEHPLKAYPSMVCNESGSVIDFKEVQFMKAPDSITFKLPGKLTVCSDVQEWNIWNGIRSKPDGSVILLNELHPANIDEKSFPPVWS